MNFDVHVGGEDAGGDGEAVLAELAGEVLDEGFGVLGVGGVGEGGAAAFAGVAVEGELGDEEDGSAYVG